MEKVSGPQRNVTTLAKQQLAHAAFNKITDMTDVVIVGAGLSGLAAAKQLFDDKHYQFKLLEAKNRVGGRTVNQQLTANNGQRHTVDGGAQWVGATHIHLQSLLKELGLSTFITPQEGETITQGEQPPQLQQELNTLRAELNRLASSLPLGSPWLAVEAHNWDNQTVQDWMLSQNYSTDAVQELDYSVQSFLAAPITEISFLYLLHYIRSAGSIEQLEILSGGAQDSLIVEGAQSISLALQKQLESHIQFDAVTKVEDHGEFCLVECQSGQLILCQSVIFAMTPTLLKNIDFSPALPPEKNSAVEQWNTSHGSIKAHVLYSRPFWREQGLSGISFIPNEVLASTFDGTRESGEAGVLTVFVNSSDAMRALSLSARRDRILRVLSELFGEQAFEAQDYVETDWQQVPYQSGCESPLHIGKLTKFKDSLQKPHGSIYFCGTELATIWTGYMEGAITSGYRAAAEVITALNQKALAEFN
ncbi:flavin monoamine oxidase family protein [Pseudoalteromonas sp. T1lg65]|uniref:flavin monoamine oxidase family protein n=1 Tax=Pseudoalteromonas sp. T1lg65 TaxID=2077101 RepID=UPI003F78B207